MTQKQKDQILANISKLATDILEVLPDGYGMAIHIGEDGFISVNSQKWGKPEVEGDHSTAKRRDLININCTNGRWGMEMSDDMNEFYREKGCLLEENENAPAFAEAG